MSQFIQNFTIFKNLNTEHKAYLFKLLEKLEFKKGELIVKEGATDRSIYFIYSGSVRIVKETELGETLELVYLNTGNYFGEFSLIDHEPRSASVEAFDDTVIYRLGFLEYTEFCRKFPEVESQILKGFLLDTVRKLRTTIDDQAITQSIIYGL